MSGNQGSQENDTMTYQAKSKSRCNLWVHRGIYGKAHTRRRAQIRLLVHTTARDVAQLTNKLI